MGEMGGLWGYEEENDDMEQLRQKLLELEKLQSEGAEEMIRRNKECINQLIHLLKCALHERDEARNQLIRNLSLGSNSLAETCSYHSPVDGARVSSSEILINTQFCPVLVPKTDQGSLIIDNLAKGRVLPQKGRLLEALLRAGPLLQTLLVAGPLPRWRNPPQFQITPTTMSINPCEVEPVQVMASRTPNYASFISSGMNGVGYAPLAKRQRFF